MNNNQTKNLTIVGKGCDVEKMQKRLRCAARATATELHLSWQHEYPQIPGLPLEHSVVVTYIAQSGEVKLLIDGLIATEEIETLLTQI